MMDGVSVRRAWPSNGERGKEKEKEITRRKKKRKEMPGTTGRRVRMRTCWRLPTAVQAGNNGLDGKLVSGKRAQWNGDADDKRSELFLCSIPYLLKEEGVVLLF